MYYNEDICVAVDDPESKGIHVLPLQGLMSWEVLWEELARDISGLSSLLDDQLLEGKESSSPQ